MQVADPFHVVRVANTALDEYRRPVVGEPLSSHRQQSSGSIERVQLAAAMTEGVVLHPS
jgi:hypothetical protein